MRKRYHYSDFFAHLLCDFAYDSFVVLRSYDRINLSMENDCRRSIINNEHTINRYIGKYGMTCYHVIITQNYK